MGKWLVMCLMLLAAQARADVTVRLDAAATALVSEPQRTYYLPGPEVGAGVYWGLASFLDVTAGVGYSFTPRSTTSPLQSGASGIRLSGGARVRTSMERSQYVPFGEATAGVVFTGPVATFGLQLGAGILFRLAKGLFLGPRVGFQQLLRVGSISAFPSADASFVSLGICFEFPVFSSVRDRDDDGVLDPDDKCPDVAGRPEDDGCPPTKPEARPVEKPKATVLRARLVDLDDKPLTGTIRFPRLGNKERTYDANPTVEIELEPGDYRIEAEAEGFLVRGRSVTLKEGETLTTDFVLRPVPKVKTASLTTTEVTISQQINFEFGKSTILTESYFILDEVTDVLLRNPRLRQVRVEGHTDDVGGAERNQILSEERALAVTNYLIEHGVAPNRLVAQGFGLTKPLTSNKTDAGRAKNRRVQFRIIDQEPR